MIGEIDRGRCETHRHFELSDAGARGERLFGRCGHVPQILRVNEPRTLRSMKV